MKLLLKQELIIQNKINNLLKYSFVFFLFCSSTINLINSQEKIQLIGLGFSVIIIPLIFINLSQLLINQDINDGSLELLLTTSSASEIILAKFLAVTISILVSFLLNLPLIYIIYNLAFDQLILVFYLAFILITLSSALTMLIAAIQGYFRSNTNILSLLIMPIIVPNIIIAGIILEGLEFNYLSLIMVGINLIIIPICLALASYLLANIYNI